MPAADQTRPGGRHHPDPGHAAPGQRLAAHRDLGERRDPVLPAGDGPDRERHDPGHLPLQDRRPRHHVHRRGTRASATSSAPRDDPQITRSFYLDGPAADKIGDRARALRLATRRADRLRRRPAHRPRTRPGLLAARRPRRRHGQRPATVVGHRARPARRPAPGRLRRLDRRPSSPPRSSRTACPPARSGSRSRAAGNGNRRGITRADLHKALGAAERRRRTDQPRPTAATATTSLDDDPREEGGERSA